MSSMTRAASALAAPGRSSAPPLSRRARKPLLMSWLSIGLLQPVVEYALAGGPRRRHGACRQDGQQRVEPGRRQAVNAPGGGIEALPLRLPENVACQRLELADIVVPVPRLR